MKHVKQISRDFYRHITTGDILVIERHWDGTLSGSCPASEPLKDLDAYQCTPGNNSWIQGQSDKLIMM